jgi:adenosylcobinamide-GDP ribazoletransferase
MWAMPQAREKGLAASVGPVPGGSVAAGLVLCLGIAAVVLPLAQLAAAAVALGLVAAGMAVLAQRKIGGITGDVLGATQQVSALAVLLTCLSL